LNADQIISHWQATPDDLEQLDPMIKELRNLTHGAAHAYLPPMADLGNRLQQIYQAVINRELEISDDLCATLNSAHLALLDMVDAVAAGQNLSAIPPAVEAALANYCGEPTLPVPELETETETETNDETTTASTNDEVKAEDIEVEPDSNLEPTHHLEQDITAAHSTDESEIEFVERPDTQAVMADEQEDVDAVAASEFSEPEVTDSLTEDTDDTDPAAVASVPSTETTYASADDIEVALDIDEDDGDFDPEIVEIFIEEATELLEDIERALHDWQDDWNNT